MIKPNTNSDLTVCFAKLDKLALKTQNASVLNGFFSLLTVAFVIYYYKNKTRSYRFILLNTLACFFQFFLFSF
jgi:hypothetical protein